MVEMYPMIHVVRSFQFRKAAMVEFEVGRRQGFAIGAAGCFLSVAAIENGRAALCLQSPRKIRLHFSDRTARVITDEPRTFIAAVGDVFFLREEQAAFRLCLVNYASIKICWQGPETTFSTRGSRQRQAVVDQLLKSRDQAAAEHNIAYA
jgi:hypothetical protein